MKKPVAKKAPTDGRVNPAQNDPAKFAEFREGVKAKKLPPKILAAVVQRTPVTHQSGKGTRGERGSVCGVSKTALIRWWAHTGRDANKLRVLFVSAGVPMTPGVFRTNWRAGENGLDLPEIDKATANEILKLVK